MPGRRVLDRVLESVGDRLVEEDRIDLDRGRFKVDLEGATGQPRPQALDRPPDEVVELEYVALGFERSGLDPAQIEEVGDESVQVLDLAVDGVDALRLVVRR